VLAMPNLNGDYMSDALAAQVESGHGAGGNIEIELRLEATHGTAPSCGKDMIIRGL